MYAHLITVGTSILRNFASLKEEQAFVEKRGMKDWHLMNPDDERQRLAESLAYRGNEAFEKLLSYVDKAPKEASAELNALYRFMELNMQRPNQVEAYLYSTETGTGWLCSHVLYHHLKGRGFKAQQPIKLKGLGRGVDFFDVALLEVVDKVVRMVKAKKEQGLRVFVNATAGFKPEATLLVVASMLAGADQAYYVHEAFKEVVTIPLPPLTVNPSYREALKPLLLPLPKHHARELLTFKGLNLAELEEKGLLKEEGGNVTVREWVKKLLEH
ncbi:MAG: putative CRISPR-associated protein [Candidatus Nezhaarchaeales archaeon]